MDGSRFDAWTRRRFGFGLTTGGLVASLAGLAAMANHAAAKRNRKKKLKRNQYGCVNVGGACRGKNKHCCSGRCQGKKPKKGEKDNSHCVAHDTGALVDGEGGCRVEDDSCGGPITFCTTDPNHDARCRRTTGNAGFCSASGTSCVPCQRDADCIGVCGPAAACVVCPDQCPGLDAACHGTLACS